MHTSPSMPPITMKNMSTNESSSQESRSESPKLTKSATGNVLITPQMVCCA